MPSRRTNRAVAFGVVPALAASFLAGCGEEEEQAYCVDQDDVVVENRFCDDDYGVGPAFFFWSFGSTTYARGQKIKGGTKIRAADRAALARRGGFGTKGGSRSGVGKTFTRSGGG